MKKLLISILCLGFLLCTSIKVEASYNYGPGDVFDSAPSIKVERVIDQSNLISTTQEKVSKDIYSFGEIKDIASYKNNIYVVDSTNNCVVVLNDRFEYVTYFPSDKSLKSPRGIYLANDLIYVCDYGNNKVVVFDMDYNQVMEVTTPSDIAFKDYEFRPKKVTVNRTGRMFVIAEGINEGILDFNPDGTFSRYYGMNSVSISGWQAFWLLFTSEEQREIQGFNFGNALTNLCIDKDEYIYTVSSTSANGIFVKKLNFRGSDVLPTNKYTVSNGDSILPPTSTPSSYNVPLGPSSFVDIDVNEIGTYVALDATRGRIFAYDFEGNLLYIGGELSKLASGTSVAISGTFSAPEAICYFKDKILVIDSKNQNIVVFGFTEFGNLINEATNYYYNYDYEGAFDVWQKVINLNTNYYLAYNGLGKCYLRRGEYEQAMHNLKLGYDTYNYSRAYEQYRYNKMIKVAPFIIGAVILLILGGSTFAVVRKIKLSESEEE